MTTEQIELHEGHAAVNVKIRGSLVLPSMDQVDQSVLDRAYEEMVEEFWEEAAILAHKRNYAHVFSEGRSDGWCVPFYQTARDGRTQFTRWPGQGPEYGYPRYPNVKQPNERKKFLAFRRDIRKLFNEQLAYYPERVKDLLESNAIA